MSVRTDQVNLIINVNGNVAQNQLNELKKKAADLKGEMQGLKKSTQEYKDKAAELKQVQTQMTDLKKQIGLTALSQKELVAELTKLKALRGSVVPFSKEFKELDEQIKAVDKRLYDVRNGVQGFASFWSKINDQVKQFGVAAAAYLGFQFITGQFQNIINGAGKLSDQLADLQRVAGLTAAEAKELNSQLSGLDTRTSTAGLREIAIIAGKLGVAKGDIFSFTKAVDQLVVSLGDELGNAGDITDKLGKILNVFDGKITGDNISKLGNSFVELANTGAASGAFIADFDQRLSGIAKSAGISLGALSGLGAGIEEMGGRVESSSMAIQKLIISIASDIPKAAKIAGVDVNKFNELFSKDPTEALLLYSQGLVKNKQSFAEITSAFKDAGEEGARTIETITKLGTNADILRGRIDLGKKSILETTSTTEAYRLKNETLGAEIDKLGKSFNKLISSSLITGFVTGLVKGLNSIIGAFSNTETALNQFATQAEKVKSLEQNMLPLLGRIDELSWKSELSKNEQIELHNSIEAVAKTIPSAAIEFDKYGKAISISTGKAREFIETQQLILKEKNRDAISEQNKSIADLQKELPGYQSQLGVFQRKAADLYKVIAQLKKTGIMPENSAKELDFYNKGIAQLTEKISLIQGRIKGAQGYIDQLQGKDPLSAIKNSDNKPEDSLQKQIGLIKKLQEEIKKLDDARPDLTSEKAINANIAQRKKLQAELDRLEGREAKKSPAEKKQENELESLKKQYQKFLNEIQQLKEKAQVKGEEPDQAEIDAVTNKYNELFTQAENYFIKLHIAGDKANAVEKQLAEAQLQEILNIKQKYFNKGSEENYKQSLNEIADFLEQQKAQYAKAYSEQQITEQQYQDLLTGVDKEGFEMRLQTAKEYAAYTKDAKTDEVKFQLAYDKFLTEEKVKEYEKRKNIENRDAAAKAEKEVILTKPGTNARFEAEKNRLKVLHDIEMQATNLTAEEKLKLEAQYNENVKQLSLDRTKEIIAQVEQYVGFFSQAISSMNQIANNRENAELAKDKKANDNKKANFKKQLDNKLISKAIYDKNVADSDEELDKKQKAIKRKQAEREKAFNIFQAIINTASAVVEALPNWPLAIAAGILGGFQIAAISNTPLPELAKGKWFEEGPSHAQGGIPVEIEGGEAVITKKAMVNKKQYTVTGTTAQITSALNSMGGGVNWAGGAVVQMAPWRTAPPARINPEMPRIMEQGGIVRPLPGREEQSAGISNELLQVLINEQRANTDEIKTMKTKLHAVVSIKEYQEKEAQYNAAKAASR